MMTMDDDGDDNAHTQHAAFSVCLCSLDGFSNINSLTMFASIATTQTDRTNEANKRSDERMSEVHVNRKISRKIGAKYLAFHVHQLKRPE